MKKIFSIGLLVALTSFATAQDTVRYLDPWYAYTTRGVQVEYPLQGNIYSCNDAADTSVANLLAVSVRAVPNNHSLLYGIAVTLRDSVTVPNCGKSDFTSIIFRAFHGVTRTPFNGTAWYWAFDHSELLYASRNNIKQCLFEYTYDYPANSSTIAHCYEYYFDQPVSIATDDTLFIGITNGGVWELLSSYDTTGSQLFLLVYPYNSYCFPINGTAASNWGGLFPIVELRCTAPRGFHLCDEAAPTACWSGDTNAEVYQVSVCSILIEPELGTLATTYDTSYDLSYLHPDSAYLVYLRKQCGFISDTVWSDWSGPLVIGDTTGWAGNVGIAEATGPKVTLTPNPAADRVTVAAEGMESVELIGTDGSVLLRKECHGRCELDLAGLASGIYMVRVSTPTGTATKRLVVQ